LSYETKSVLFHVQRSVLEGAYLQITTTFCQFCDAC